MTAEEYLAWCRQLPAGRGFDDLRTWGDVRDVMERRLDKNLKFEIEEPVELRRFHNAKIKALESNTLSVGLDRRSALLREPRPGSLFANYHVVAEAPS